MILLDDLDAQSYFDAHRFPVFDHELVQRGTTFTHHFVTDSLCCPSRASILRGQLVHNHGTLGNEPPRGGFERFIAAGDEQSTVATWLHDAGYRTALFGKYLNGYPKSTNRGHIPPGWDEWASPVAGNPYRELGYVMNENGREVRYGTKARDYMVDVLTQKSVDFVRRASATEPFFLEIAPYVPHQPATPAPRFANRFAGARAPRTASFDRRAGRSEPDWLRTRPPLSPPVVDYTDALYRKRLQDLLAVDDMIRSVVDALRASGRLDSTYLVVTSDNGFHLGQHRLPPGKQTPFEEDIRVPLVVRGPGVPSGARVDAMTATTDLAPTIAALAGAPIPEFVDGRSLVPLLGGDPPPADWRDVALIEHYELVHPPRLPPDQDPYREDAPDAPSEPDDDAGYAGAALADVPRSRLSLDVFVPSYQAIRTSRYLYAEYSGGARQLYDLRDDPHELHDLVRTADPALLQRLHDRLAALGRCAGATCRALDGDGG